MSTQMGSVTFAAHNTAAVKENNSPHDLQKSVTYKKSI